MKPIPLALVAVIGMSAAVRSQEQAAVAPANDSAAAAAIASLAMPAAARPILPTPARIIGNIPDGTPPPPQAPKPEFVARGTDILVSKVHQQGGRTITIQEIKPIALPPPPAPQPASPAAQFDNAAFKQRLADYRANHPPSTMLLLGATVYHLKDSPPRTLVQNWPNRGGDPITFWSSADFALLSGIRSFAATDGRNYDLCLMCDYIDTMRAAAFSRGKYHLPDVPALPDGPATFTIVGTPPADPSVLAPIQSLHDLYNKEFWRLKTAREGRERARLQHEADLKAHPPQPKNIVVNFWTTDTPAPANKGAAR